MSIERVITILETELSALSEIQSLSVHPKRKDRITLPAILIDLAEIEPGSDRGTDQTPLLLHWEARVVTSDRDPPTVTWMLVQRVLRWLHEYEWRELDIGKAKLKSASPDHFSPELQGHRVWLVEFIQEIRVAENIWDGEPPNIEQIILYFPNCEPEPDPIILEVGSSS